MRVTSETKTATRQRILDVAQERFAELGFEATTTRDIASAAKIAVGTLFNYFPTKEAIVECLVTEACAGVADKFPRTAIAGEQRSLEEELFAHIAAVMRKLNPFRKYLLPVLETSFSPLAAGRDDGAGSMRIVHLETVTQIGARHGCERALSTVALQLYWTLFTGVLAFWANDRSPRQEDTLALLDQSLAMFVGWLTVQKDSDSNLTKE
ncbi:MAG: TetR/AcrR family transcriptional regulator [Planctomycetes bacterium]|nr:TetR/AcrR family transcriptional regulator [Planctomycetota bacterium]